MAVSKDVIMEVVQGDMYLDRQPCEQRDVSPGERVSCWHLGLHGRIVTAENFYASICLPEDQLIDGLAHPSTYRSNKPRLPGETKASHNWEVHSSVQISAHVRYYLLL